MRISPETRARFVILASVAALGVVLFGVFQAMRSPLFTVQVVEVSELPENAPLSVSQITELVAVPLGKTNLFDLDLGAIERRVLANGWIREVGLQKRFPQTLVVGITFREPVAFFQPAQGPLAYLDGEGRVFGKVNLAWASSLPLVQLPPEQLPSGLKLLHELKRALGTTASFQIASLVFDPEKGYRAVVSYPVGADRARASVTWGQEIDAEVEAQASRLRRVVEYLSSHGVAARQIFADAGKKIVVKIARRS